MMAHTPSEVRLRMPRTGPSKSDIDFAQLDQGKAAVYGVGIFSGIITALFPLSVIKTRQMATPEAGAGVNGAVEIAKRMYAREGVTSFYRGFGTAIVGAIPTRMVYLPAYEMSRASAGKSLATYTSLSEKTRRFLANSFGGAFASVASSAIVVPIDVVSSRLMVDNGASRSAPAPPSTSASAPARPPQPSGAPLMLASSKKAPPAMGDGSKGSGRAFSARASAVQMNGLSMATHILRTEGIAGLYRGIGMSLMTYTPSSAVWWSAYSLYQDTIWASLFDANYDLSDSDVGAIMAVQAVSGMCAGATSATVTTPLDVVKTQLQVAGRCQTSAKYSTLDIVKSIYRTEGIRGFWRGAVPRTANVMLWGTCMVSGYEVLKRSCTRQ